MVNFEFETENIMISQQALQQLQIDIQQHLIEYQQHEQEFQQMQLDFQQHLIDYQQVQRQNICDG